MLWKSYVAIGLEDFFLNYIDELVILGLKRCLLFIMEKSQNELLKYVKALEGYLNVRISMELLVFASFIKDLLVDEIILSYFLRFSLTMSFSLKYLSSQVDKK